MYVERFAYMQNGPTRNETKMVYVKRIATVCDNLESIKLQRSKDGYHLKDNLKETVRLDIILPQNSNIISNSTGFNITCQYASVQTMSLWIKEGTSINVTDSIRNTPLHAACRSIRDAYEKVKVLTELDRTLVDKENKYRITPLHIAAKHNDPRICAHLVTLVKNVNAVSTKLLTPLHVASHYGRVDSDDLSRATRSLVGSLARCDSDRS